MRQVGITEKGGSGGMGHGWGIFEFPVSCIDSAQGEENAITRALSALSGKVWCVE